MTRRKMTGKQQQLVLLLLLLISAPCYSNAMVKKKSWRREEEPPPKCRTSTCSVVKSSYQRPNVHHITLSGVGSGISHPSSNNSMRMKDQPPILDRLDLPQTDITLLLEEQEQTAVQPTNRFGTVGLWLAVASSALIILASTTLPMLEMKIASVIAFVPWMYAAESVKQKVGLLLVEFMVTAQVLTQLSVWAHVQTKVLPWVTKNIEKMIYFELWRQAWSFVGKAILNRIFQQNLKGFDNLPEWMQSAVRSVDGFFRRGTEKLFKKRVEKVVGWGFDAALDFVATWKW